MKSSLTFKFVHILLAYLPLLALAQTIEQKELNYKVDAEQLLKGEIHFAFRVLSPKSLRKEFPEMTELDTLGLMNKRDASLLITKASYVVNKPAGFFDQQSLDNEDYNSFILRPQKLKKIAPSTYLVTVPGPKPFTYKMQSYFDSDDITTVPNSRAVKALTAMKKVDVLSQSGSSLVYKELTHFTLSALGGVSLYSYIPLKEERTLVIFFQLLSLEDYTANSSQLKANISNEIQATRNLINRYSTKE